MKLSLNEIFRKLEEILE